MTLIVALVFIVLVLLFLLSAVLDDAKTSTKKSLDLLGAQYQGLAEQEVSDRHWVAKRQLELTAKAEMSRIADLG